MRTLALIVNDLRMQIRQNIVTAYAVVVLLYLAILMSLPPDIRRLLLPFLIYSDPAAVGFFFVGGWVLLERMEGVNRALSITPVRPTEWIAARALSLSIISVVSSLILTLTDAASADWVAVLVAVLLSSLFFGLSGLAIVMRVRTLNQYFGLSVGIYIPLMGVFALYYFTPNALIWNMVPFTGALNLLRFAFGSFEMNFAEIATAILCLMLGLAVMWRITIRAFVKATYEGRE